jgi:hypothetical protein
MTTVAITAALVLLFVIAIIKRLLKFAIVLALIGLAYWFFVR